MTGAGNAAHLRRAHALVIVLALTSFTVLAWSQAVTSSSQIAHAPLALVTLYSNGTTVLGGFPGKQSQSYRGLIFMGHDKLAYLDRGRFITFSVPSGPHEFTASSELTTGPLGGAHIKIDLVAGQHYFVEARTRNLGIPPFGIKMLTCAVARAFAADYPPLEPEHIRPAGKPLAIIETAFPTCK